MAKKLLSVSEKLPKLSSGNEKFPKESLENSKNSQKGLEKPEVSQREGLENLKDSQKGLGEPKVPQRKVKNRAKKETLFVFGAHSDDFVIGAGGTIAKYTKEGKKIFSFVFSYGEKSHPWLKPKVAQKMRSEEAFQASRLLGCQTTFFGLEELHFLKDYQEKKLEEKLIKLIKKEKPTKIFTHSMDDPWPDHQALHKITLALWEKLPKPKPEIYVYSIWNPISLRTQYPVLYEDITKTFSLKLQALKTFPSQKLHAFYPSLLMFYRAIKNGLKIKKRYAERFYRIK